MTNATWARVAALSGLVFAVLFVVGMIIPDLPSGHDSDAKVLSFYGERSDRLRVIFAGYLLAAAGIAFLWFLNHLRGRLRAAEADSGWAANAMLIGGVVFVSMLFAGATAFIAVAGAVTFGDTPQPSPDVSRILVQLGFGMVLLYGGIAAAFTVAAASLAMLRTREFPDWLAWLGFLAAVVLLFGVLFFPMIALPIWVLAVCFVLVSERREEMVTAA